MAIALITENHGDELKSLFSRVREKMLIISPFMGKNTCEALAAAKQDNVQYKIITRFYREDFMQSASSLDGLQSLIEKGATIFALRHLHTKLYVFDEFASIITSANFTTGGLFSNFELGVKVEDDPVVSKCRAYFDDLWFQIEKYNFEHDNKALVTPELIRKESEREKEEEKLLKRSGTISKWYYGAELPRHGKGADDIFESALKSGQSSAPQSSSNEPREAWLKYEYSSNDRCHAEEYPVNFDVNGKKHCDIGRTTDPKKNMKDLKSNERIFLAVYAEGQPGPIIIGRGYSDGNPGTNPENGVPCFYWRELEVIDGPVGKGLPHSAVTVPLPDYREQSYNRLTADQERVIEEMLKEYPMKKVVPTNTTNSTTNQSDV